MIRIEDYPNYYITKDGKVWSEDKRIFKKPYLNRGYVQIILWDHQKSRCHRINRLVATAYIPNPFNKSDVNHKDGNKQNNSIENLEWCTYDENRKHAFSLGLIDRKMVLDTSNGIYYDTIKDAAKSKNMSYSTLKLRLSGYLKNTTSFIRC